MVIGLIPLFDTTPGKVKQAVTPGVTQGNTGVKELRG